MQYISQLKGGVFCVDDDPIKSGTGTNFDGIGIYHGVPNTMSRGVKIGFKDVFGELHRAKI
jgi:hypothetical protein